MNIYKNGMKSTEFTTKQINVVYGCAKRGELKVEKWLMKELYNDAEYYGYDYNGTMESNERTVMQLLESVFSKNYEKAQQCINELTADFELYGKKFRQQADRTLVA